jgi:tRNA-specific 2-thiouridylase
VAIGMSGGVDSSTAAALLLEQGYDVIGMTMQIWDDSVDLRSTAGHACYGPDEAGDIEDAAAVAERLGIPFHVFDLAEAYKREILSVFRGEYLQGRTPNPCVRCNPLMKFGLLLEEARRSGLCFDRFATGHYVRNPYVPACGCHMLKKAVDRRKDQSYFLYALTRTQRAGCLFPLGALTKDAVRRLAVRHGIPVSRKRESQDFIAGDYTCLFPGGAPPGPIVDTDGRELGRHDGIHRFTVGQRKGLGIQAPEPLYVVRIDGATNTIVVGREDALYRRSLRATAVTWAAGSPPAAPLRVAARTRYAAPDRPATVHPDGPDAMRVEFDAPLRAITPGQAVVLYKEDLLIGGGTIAATED